MFIRLLVKPISKFYIIGGEVTGHENEVKIIRYRRTRDSDLVFFPSAVYAPGHYLSMNAK